MRLSARVGSLLRRRMTASRTPTGTTPAGSPDGRSARSDARTRRPRWPHRRWAVSRNTPAPVDEWGRDFHSNADAVTNPDIRACSRQPVPVKDASAVIHRASTSAPQLWITTGSARLKRPILIGIQQTIIWPAVPQLPCFPGMEGKAHVKWQESAAQAGVTSEPQVIRDQAAPVPGLGRPSVASGIG